MMEIRTVYAGLSLRNPVIVGSSGLSSQPEKIKEYERAGAGAVVLKSLFEEQIEMQCVDLLSGTYAPEADGYIREYVKANEVSKYLDLIKRAKDTCTIPVIASINCYRADAWIEFARQIELAGADAMELNVYLLETDIVKEVDDNRRLYTDILRKVRDVVKIPVIIKLGKSFGNLPAMVNMLKNNGASGVVLFNRFFRPDININTMQLVSGNVFSNHSELGDTLRWTAIVSGLVPGISIASSTGVHDWEDVIKCLLAGASAVQMTSAVYMHGSEIITQILTCMEEWMSHSHYLSLGDFQGILNYAHIKNPALYERAQFMKYFSNRD
jgi:dihydroorotate dehydrogenase (fumarate)